MASTPVHESLKNPAPWSVAFESRVNFASVFEGLFNTAFKDRITPELRAELASFGVNLEVLNVGYPHAAFLKSVDAGARHWFPNEPADVAWFKIGARNLEGFYETFLGKPLFVLLRVLGPKRTIGRMQGNFRSANNYAESKMVEIGPSEVQLWMNEPGLIRHFIRGVMTRGLQLAGAPEVKIEDLTTDDKGTVYRFTW